MGVLFNKGKPVGVLYGARKGSDRIDMATITKDMPGLNGLYDVILSDNNPNKVIVSVVSNNLYVIVYHNYINNDTFTILHHMYDSGWYIGYADLDIFSIIDDGYRIKNLITTHISGKPAKNIVSYDGDGPNCKKGIFKGSTDSVAITCGFKPDNIVIMYRQDNETYFLTNSVSHIGYFYSDNTSSETGSGSTYDILSNDILELTDDGFIFTNNISNLIGKDIEYIAIKEYIK